MMDEFWNVVGNFSAICSIIGLPIALIQIWKMHSTTKAMEQAINNFLSLEKIATMNKIFNTIATQKNLLVSVYNNTTKKGISSDKINEECKNIIIEINTCIDNLPGEYVDVESLLVKGTECLIEYIRTNDAQKIRECENFLYGAISGLKKIKEKNREFEVNTVSKNS